MALQLERERTQLEVWAQLQRGRAVQVEARFPKEKKMA